MSFTPYLTFKKQIKRGDKFYIIVKECPPIILSDKNTKEYKLKSDDLIWKAREVVVDYVDFNSEEVYDENDMIISDDIVKFSTLQEAQLYCAEKNKKEKEKNNE